MRDKQIIEELKKGNNDAFGALYEYLPQTESYILQNSGSKDDAKDIFQNTLIILYKKVLSDDFQLISKLSTYIYSISKNLWLDQLRKRKKTQSIPLENEDEIELDLSFEKPNVSLEKYILNKLHKLGEPCLSILIMHSYRKTPMSQIANHFGYANEHTARQQKYKCLQRLKKDTPYHEIKQYLS